MPPAIEPASLADSFIPVSASMLTPSTIIGVPLYVLDAHSGKYTLFRAAHYQMSPDDLAGMRSHGIARLYIKTHDQEVLQEYLRDSLSRNLRDESISVEGRFFQLNEVVRDVLREAFGRGNVQDIVERSQSISRKTVDLICRSDAVASKLCAVLHHDYHTFTHTANVSYMCVILAKAIGISNRKELDAIAGGAILHDLGKLEIPAKVLTKPGKLSDTEFALVRQHPTTGFLALGQQQDLSLGQLMMVYQHHEKLDGKGYPVGVEDATIHPWAKICTVCDVYEALTSNRPYRAGMSSKDALELMERQVGAAFDKELFQCWKTIMLCC